MPFYRYSTFLFTNDGDVFVFGCNGEFELGLDHCNNISVPQLLPSPNKNQWACISCTSWQTFGMTKNGKWFGWGYNQVRGLVRLNVDEKLEDAYIITPHPVSPEYRFRSLSGGYDHFVGVTENGDCFFWRFNGPQAIKIVIPNNEKVIETQNGSFCSIIKTEGKQWYGLKPNDDQVYELLKTPFASLNGIYSVSMGTHIIAISLNGNLLVWGENHFGQLGLGDHKDRFSSFTPLFLPNNSVPFSISCGRFHSTVITNNGDSYVWGNNRSGQLGIELDIENTICGWEETPQLLQLSNGKKFFSLLCKESCTIGFTEDNQCYVWGSNGYGQLGIGDLKQCCPPTLLPCPKQGHFFIPPSSFNWISLRSMKTIFCRSRIILHDLNGDRFGGVPLPLKMIMFSYLIENRSLNFQQLKEIVQYSLSKKTLQTKDSSIKSCIQVLIEKLQKLL